MTWFILYKNGLRDVMQRTCMHHNKSLQTIHVCNSSQGRGGGWRVCAEGSFYQRGLEWVMIMSNVWNLMYTVYTGSQYTHAGVECLVSYFFFFSLASLIYIPIVIKRKELRNVEISFKFKWCRFYLDVLCDTKDLRMTT